jgi:CRISPR type III-A-associated protein Csm2
MQNDIPIEEFSYKDSSDEFLEKVKEFAKNLAGEKGVDLSKSQLRKFYDQVVSLRDEVLQHENSEENEKNEEKIDVIFRLRLLQARVIYLSKRKSDRSFVVGENARKYLLGILERGISLCKNEKDDAKALKKFVMEFEAIYAYFYFYALPE